MKLTGLFVLALVALGSGAARAAVVGETVEYRLGEQVFRGYVAFDNAQQGKRPGVVVVHDWMGLGEFAKERARDLAAMGYVALAADIYGDGKLAKDGGEAGQLAGGLKQDRAELRRRVRAAFDALLARKDVDAARTAAIGYCFGGTTAIELARSGAPVAGIVSFHGGLDSPTPADGKNIKARILALHGADDPFVPAKDLAAFEDELRQAKVDWQLVAYGGAVHAFTNPSAGNDNAKGAAYNERAARRAWQAMATFLKDVFGR